MYYNFCSSSPAQKCEEPIVDAVHGIVHVDPDLQGSVAGMAAGGEWLGNVHRICLPAIVIQLKRSTAQILSQLLSLEVVLSAYERLEEVADVQLVVKGHYQPVVVNLSP